ncbi:hypothetical protein [Delftia sp. WSY_13]|uniref:hypothetical protein n=1 Tax=unclassified Delftia TaxID=2613839 RepID=UPI00370B1D11
MRLLCSKTDHVPQVFLGKFSFFCGFLIGVNDDFMPMLTTQPRLKKTLSNL